MKARSPAEERMPGGASVYAPANGLFGFEHGDGLAASGVLIID
jgi:hypothetical protein